LANGKPPAWIVPVFKRVETDPESPVTGEELRSMNLTPERVRRWFKNEFGMTFTAWCRGQRLSRAFHSIRNGEELDDVILGNGFESHSGFRDAFKRVFATPPGKSLEGDCLRVTLFATDMGPMIAAASEEALCLLEFADRRGLEASYGRMKKKFGLPVIPGTNKILEKTERELQEYFARKLRRFTVPVAMKGTPFQEDVWRELQRIPYGKTASYAEIAKRVGRPTALRAVAQTNAINRLYILVPCHRVIASDGSLSGYGGGVWRKRLLLELERGIKPGNKIVS
jgi:AraC family transcriptional regulator of adaptative response/methylated-DNA-[protein]-cysteine methyltransferase